MKNIFQCWERTISAILLFIFILAIVFFTQKSKDYQKYIFKKAERYLSGELKNVSQQYPEEEGYIKILEKMKKNQADFSQFKTQRNIFAQVTRGKIAQTVLSDKPVFELLEIGYKPLGIEYRGRIVFADGQIIAQVNLYNQTYLVKKGTKFCNYEVLDLEKEYLEIVSQTTKSIRLTYQKTTYTKELVAKIKELNSQQIVTVSKDSEFLGFKVLDIDKDYVLLSNQGQRLKLEKGWSTK